MPLPPYPCGALASSPRGGLWARGPCRPNVLKRPKGGPGAPAELDLPPPKASEMEAMNTSKESLELGGPRISIEIRRMGWGKPIEAQGI